MPQCPVCRKSTEMYKPCSITCRIKQYGIILGSLLIIMGIIIIIAPPVQLYGKDPLSTKDPFFLNYLVFRILRRIGITQILLFIIFSIIGLLVLYVSIKYRLVNKNETRLEVNERYEITPKQQEIAKCLYESDVFSSKIENMNDLIENFYIELKKVKKEFDEEFNTFEDLIEQEGDRLAEEYRIKNKSDDLPKYKPIHKMSGIISIAEHPKKAITFLNDVEDFFKSIK